LHASLYANNRDNHFATLDYDKIAKRDGYIFVPGKASLLSQTSNRDLLVSVESDGGGSQFIKLNLRANPRKEDEVWSGWVTATEQADLSPVPDCHGIAVRYRLQRVEYHSHLSCDFVWLEGFRARQQNEHLPKRQCKSGFQP